jgi:hypothetical protein
MAYKRQKDGVGVIRLSDMASIPECVDNVDWRAYLEWLAKGNTPAPAETPEEIAKRTEREAKAAQMAQTLRENLPTYAQVMTAVDNIANLADARAFLKKLAAVTYIHIKGDNV